MTTPEKTDATQEDFVKAIEEMAANSVKSLQQINTLAKLVVDLSKRVKCLEDAR